MSRSIVQTLRERLDAATVHNDAEFLEIAPSAALLATLEESELHAMCTRYIAEHTSPTSMALTGLRAIEDYFATAIGEDLSLGVTLTQQWALLVPFLERAVGDAKRLEFSRLVRPALGHLETMALQADLDDDAVEAIEEWRSHTGLAEERQIGAVASVMTGEEREFVGEVRHLRRMRPFEEVAEPGEAQALFAAAPALEEVVIQHRVFSRTESEVTVKGVVLVDVDRVLASFDDEQQVKGILAITAAGRLLRQIDDSPTFECALDDETRGRFEVVVRFVDGSEVRGRLERL